VPALLSSDHRQNARGRREVEMGVSKVAITQALVEGLLVSSFAVAQSIEQKLSSLDGKATSAQFAAQIDSILQKSRTTTRPYCPLCETRRLSAGTSNFCTAFVFSRHHDSRLAALHASA
jgi:hypothetical protein